jgi:hypothetical protein
MLYMTRISMLDTMQDLDVNLLVTANRSADRLFRSMVFPDTAEVADTHPVMRMWTGYHVAVAAYATAAEAVMVGHGIHTGSASRLRAGVVRQLRADEDDPFVMPPWHEDTDVLRSHRSNIMRRWPADYADVWPKTPERMPYLWPFLDDEGGYALFVSKHDKELLAKGERKLPKNIAEKVENL